MKRLFTLCMTAAFATNLMEQNLSGVESVEYDPVNNRYLASSDKSGMVAIDSQKHL